MTAKLNEEQFTDIVDQIEGIKFQGFVDKMEYKVIFEKEQEPIAKLWWESASSDEISKWMKPFLRKFSVKEDYLLAFMVEKWPQPFAKVYLSEDLQWVKPLVEAQKGFSISFVRPDDSLFLRFELFEGYIEATVKTKSP